MLIPVRPPDDEGLEGSASSARHAGGVPTARRALRAAYRMDEAACVRERAERARLSPAEKSSTAQLAAELVTAVRARRTFGIEAFLREYGLDTREGVVLLCVAEALLRIPDAATADRLIRDKIGGTEWDRHLGASPSLFVNASTWGLMLTGSLVRFEPEDGAVRRIIDRAGEPVVRAALLQAMKILGHQFVLGRTIAEAMSHAAADEKKGVRFSYDMLGEGARTADDDARYLERYAEAIAALGASKRGTTIADRPGISVKLSALHPRYEFAKGRRLHNELLPCIVELAALARTHNVGLCIDAEEADRLEPSLDLIERLAYDPALSGWDGLGLAAQAYQKRGLPLIAWLEDLARRTRRRLMVRLVKGAYWDTEIKRAQESGVILPPPGYFQRVRALCTRHNVVLVLDEIQTGLGRTGKLLAEEHDGIEADVTLIGKALAGGFYPMSAVLSNLEVLGVLKPGEHGSTFGGNPLACAIARTALRVLVEEGMIQNAAEQGAYLLSELRKLRSNVIQEVRGRGLMIALQLVAAAGGARRFSEALKDAGVLCKETQTDTLRFAPPQIKRSEVDYALEAISKVLEAA